MRHLTIAACLLSGLCFGGCEQGGGASPPVDDCAEVNCSGHGTCFIDGDGEPRCECDAGYHAVGLACIEDGADPCAGVDCSGHGVCVVDDDTPSCECDAGYRPEGLACVEEDDDICTDAVALRRSAVEEGTTFLAGITLPSSTSLAALAADPAGFEGEHVQVEGFVTYVCEMGRNSALLQDLDGNMVRLAGNHAFDLPTALFVGNYVVVDGIFFQTFCRRGPHVNFADHGGVVGSVDCPVE